MSVDHLQTIGGKNERDEHRKLLDELAASKKMALERAKIYLAQHGEADARRHTRIDTLRSAIVTAYEQIDGHPQARAIRNCTGMTSFTLWAYWADVQLLEDGTFIEQFTYTDTQGRFVALLLLLKPEATLNEHQLRTLITCLDRLFAD